jgi:hypothetical protein
MDRTRDNGIPWTFPCAHLSQFFFAFTVTGASSQRHLSPRAKAVART